MRSQLRLPHATWPHRKNDSCLVQCTTQDCHLLRHQRLRGDFFDLLFGAPPDCWPKWRVTRLAPSSIQNSWLHAWPATCCKVRQLCAHSALAGCVEEASGTSSGRWGPVLQLSFFGFLLSHRGLREVMNLKHALFLDPRPPEEPSVPELWIILTMLKMISTLPSRCASTKAESSAALVLLRREASVGHRNTFGCAVLLYLDRLFSCCFETQKRLLLKKRQTKMTRQLC